MMDSMLGKCRGQRRNHGWLPGGRGSRSTLVRAVPKSSQCRGGKENSTHKAPKRGENRCTRNLLYVPWLLLFFITHRGLPGPVFKVA